MTRQAHQQKWSAQLPSAGWACPRGSRLDERPERSLM